MYGHRQRIGQFSCLRARFIFFVRPVKRGFKPYRGKEGIWSRMVRCSYDDVREERRQFLDVLSKGVSK